MRVTGEIPMENISIQSTQRATLNSVRIKSTDMIDRGIKVLSNFGNSEYLARNHQEDFSFNRDGMLVAKNVTEQDCTVTFHCIRCTAEYLVVRSNRVSARLLSGPAGRRKESFKTLLRAGESLTFRSCDASNPFGHQEELR
jgi:hypothetical protein